MNSLDYSKRWEIPDKETVISEVQKNNGQLGGYRTLAEKSGMGVRTPVVSIVTITKNAEKTIERAMQSVLNQSFKDIEYVIIDGESSDNTLRKIKAYETKLAYWISSKDSGISDAFNKGISLTRGKIIGLLNADDWYEQDAILNVVNVINDSDILYGKLQHWKTGEPDLTTIPSLKKINKSMTLCHPAIFVKRSVYENIGGFDRNIRYAMDYQFFLRCWKRGIKFKYIDKKLTNMDYHGSSDIHWFKAHWENLIIKNEILGKKTNNFFYFVKQVISMSARRMLEKMRLHGMVKWYRRKFSFLKKY
jgi:glycosyltransferase involved in cell wall biosynthesis